MIVKLESDWITGDLILPIPDEIMATMDWQEGDALSCRVENGQIILEKSNDNEL